MDALAERTGRAYRLVEYAGHPEATRVIVVMGSGGVTARETVASLAAAGEKVGVLQVRLYRPFPAAELVAALPRTVEWIAVLDRTKEPGSHGRAAVPRRRHQPQRGSRRRAAGEHAARHRRALRLVLQGVHSGHGRRDLRRAGRRVRPGRGSPSASTTTSAARACRTTPTSTSRTPATLRAVFYGLGSDGTVGANKNTVKILAEDPQVHAQAYFVYDSKKSGGQTVSHLRFGPRPIAAPYLVTQARLRRLPRVRPPRQGRRPGRPPRTARRCCSTAPHPARTRCGTRCPRRCSSRSSTGGCGCSSSTPTPSLARPGCAGPDEHHPADLLLRHLRGAAARGGDRRNQGDRSRKTYGRRGQEVVRAQLRRRSTAPLAALHRGPGPGRGDERRARSAPVVPDTAPGFVRTVTAAMMAGRGDDAAGQRPAGRRHLPDRHDDVREAQHRRAGRRRGTRTCASSAATAASSARTASFGPSTSTRPRSRAHRTPSPSAAAQRASACPTPVTRCRSTSRTAPAAASASRPARRSARTTRHARRSTSAARARAGAPSARNIDFFETLPVNDRSRVDFGTVRGTQFLAAALRVLRRLRGLRRDALPQAAVASSSASGCRSPTPPAAPRSTAATCRRRRGRQNAAGRGPAWSNSLFEDNAEFGLGLRLAADLHTEPGPATRWRELRDEVGADLVDAILDAPQVRESDLPPSATGWPSCSSAGSRPRRPGASTTCAASPTTWCGAACGSSAATAGPTTSAPAGSTTCSPAGATSTSSCSTPRSTPTPAASRRRPRRSARSPSSPRPARPSAKKDLALQAIAYGNVYVARVAMGADPQQTLTAFREAEAYDGPSLIIAYSHCIAHGIDMRKGLDQQYRAVASGHWPLVRYDPAVRGRGGNPFQLDSPRPRIPLEDYIYNELRYRMLRNARSRRGRAAPGAGAAGGRPALGDLRGDGHRGASSLPTRRRDARHAALIDLTTTISACALRNPLVAPPVSRCRARWTGSEPSPTPGSARSCSPPSSRSRSSRGAARDRVRPSRYEDAPRRGAGLLPRRPGPGCPGRRGRYLSLIERGRRRRRHPRHRQPQRQQPRRLDRLRPPDGGGRRGRARAQHLLRPRRPAHLGARGRGPARRDPRQVKAAVAIPVAVKLSPHFSSIGEMALRLDEAGADGLVLFNRFLHPDVDPETLVVTPGVGLSTPGRSTPAARLDRDPARAGARSLAATTGVESAATWPPTCSPAPTSS